MDHFQDLVSVSNTLSLMMLGHEGVLENRPYDAQKFRQGVQPSLNFAEISWWSVKLDIIVAVGPHKRN